jgi:hypothetical protein
LKKKANKNVGAHARSARQADTSTSASALVFLFDQSRLRRDAGGRLIKQRAKPRTSGRTETQPYDQEVG